MNKTKEELLRWYNSKSFAKQEEIHDNCPDRCWDEEEGDYTQVFIQYLDDLYEELGIDNKIDTINAFKGRYTFKSPYHKNKKLLPFNIYGWEYINEDYLVAVRTVEYKGYTRKEVSDYYTIASIQDKINSGFLTKQN